MLKLPSRLTELLAGAAALNSAVLSSFARYSRLLSMSSLPFFPEYTDHGTVHIQAVLQAADALITERSRPSLTPADAAVLAIAVLLHDIGMHQEALAPLFHEMGQGYTSNVLPD